MREKKRKREEVKALNEAIKREWGRMSEEAFGENLYTTRQWRLWRKKKRGEGD
jgi:hypothetical protein